MNNRHYTIDARKNNKWKENDKGEKKGEKRRRKCETKERKKRGKGHA